MNFDMNLPIVRFGAGDFGDAVYFRVQGGAMEMFVETHYQRAYQQGMAWAEEAFRGCCAAGRPVPSELPLSKHEAAALLEQPFSDLERQLRAASVLYAAARVRWRRLVSLEIDRRAS